MVESCDHFLVGCLAVKHVPFLTLLFGRLGVGSEGVWRTDVDVVPPELAVEAHCSA